MIERKAQIGHILASYMDENFVTAEKIYAPDNYNPDNWIDFETEEQARKYFNVPDEEVEVKHE